jgi:acyl carrier protein phosphodiesterase
VASTTTEEMMPPTGPATTQAQEALDRYNQAVERLKAGDWKGFGAQFDAMREVLEKMNQQSTGH